MKKIIVWMGVFVLVASMAIAKPGEGIRLGNLAISPFADLSATYDSNPLLTEQDQKDDIFYELVPGVAFINRTDSLILTGRGWGQFRRYSDYSELDSDGLGQRLGLILGTEENPRLTIEQKYMQLDDYELNPSSVDSLNMESRNLALTEDRNERVKRDLFSIGAVAAQPIGDKTRVDAGYGYSFVNYDTSDLYDWDENKVQLEGQRELTDKTSALLTGQYGLQSSDGFSEDSTVYLVRAGVFNRLTGKTSIKVGAGYADYATDVKSEEGKSLDKGIFNFDVAGIWEATTRLTVELSGRNGIQPATQYRSNTKEIMLVSLGVSYDLTDTILVSLAGSHREDDYVGRIEVDEKFISKERELWGGRVRVDYRPHAKFYELYLEGTYEDVNDNLQDDYNDYDQLRGTAGIFVRY